MPTEWSPIVAALLLGAVLGGMLTQMRGSLTSTTSADAPAAGDVSSSAISDRRVQSGARVGITAGWSKGRGAPRADAAAPPAESSLAGPVLLVAPLPAPPLPAPQPAPGGQHVDSYTDQQHVMTEEEALRYGGHTCPRVRWTACPACASACP